MYKSSILYRWRYVCCTTAGGPVYWRAGSYETGQYTHCAGWDWAGWVNFVRFCRQRVSFQFLILLVRYGRYLLVPQKTTKDCIGTELATNTHPAALQRVDQTETIIGRDNEFGGDC